jgi:hypothetical protein
MGIAIPPDLGCSVTDLGMTLIKAWNATATSIVVRPVFEFGISFLLIFFLW